MAKDKTTAINSNSSRFNPDDFKPKFLKAEEIINIPVILDDFKIGSATGADGEKFRTAKLITRASELSEEQVEYSTTSGQPINLLTAVQNAIEEGDTGILPAWVMFVKREGSSGRMSQQLIWVEDRGTPSVFGEAF